MSIQELVYDPLRVFVDVFSDSRTADHVGETLTCLEVNAMIALLEDCGATAAASCYLGTHLKNVGSEPGTDGAAAHSCAEPRMH